MPLNKHPVPEGEIAIAVDHPREEARRKYENAGVCDGYLVMTSEEARVALDSLDQSGSAGDGALDGVNREALRYIIEHGPLKKRGPAPSW